MGQDCVLNGFDLGKNYKPLKHCKWHHKLKNNREI